MRRTISLIVVLLTIVIQANSTHAKGVEVDRMDYHGWRGSYRIRNEVCEMVIVPQITRVMHFAFRGTSPNVLWVNPELMGKTKDREDNGWHNFGGEKVWPTEQGLWLKYTGKNAWPPPYAYDGKPAEAEEIKDGVRLTTQISGHFGARLVREFVMDAKRPLVHVRQYHEKIEGKPAEMTVWSVAQVPEPLYAMLPLGAGERRFKLQSDKLIERRFHVHRTVLSIRNDDENSQKVGVRHDANRQEGWAAAVFEGQMLVQSHTLREGRYPDEGCSQEIYTAPARDGKYVELELLGPLHELHAKERLRDDQVWQIVPLKNGVWHDVEETAEIARESHRAALETLK